MHKGTIKIAGWILSVVCVLTIFLAIGSRFRRIGISHQFTHRRLSIAVNHGIAQVSYYSWIPLGADEKQDRHPQFFGSVTWQSIGVNAEYVPRIKDPTHFKGANAILTTPCWFLIVLTGGPVMLWRIYKYRRKPLPGHCVFCGYDLRASTGRCPECGNHSSPDSATTPAPAASSGGH